MHIINNEQKQDNIFLCRDNDNDYSNSNYDNKMEIITIAQKMKFSIKDFFTFTKAIFNGKLNFLYSEWAT